MDGLRRAARAIGLRDARTKAKDAAFGALERIPAPIAAGAGLVLPDRVMPVRWLEDQDLGFQRTIEPSLPGRSVGPAVGGRQAAEDVVIPAVNLYHFEDARVSPVGSAIVLRDVVVLEGLVGLDRRRSDLSAGLVHRHGTRLALVDRRPPERIEKGIFLGGNGSFNYYHWTIELLPKIEHLPALDAEGYADHPLLVSEDVERIPTFAAGLRTDRPRIVLRKDRAYEVGSLVHLNAPSHGPFNLRRGQRFRPSDYVVRPSSIEWLRRTLPAGPPRGSRLFFARRNDRRKYNDEEIWPLFASRGFEPVYMEDLSLEEQIGAMAGADVIAGPTGGAWTNLVFCRPGTKGLCWMSGDAGDFAAFSTLAAAVGVDLRYVWYHTDVREIADLYFLPYHLDPEAVRRELDRL